MASHDANAEADDASKKKKKKNLQLEQLKSQVGVVEKAVIGACAGGIAGAVTYVALHPLDTLKTRLQTHGAAKVYAGAADAAARLGLRGLYAGVSVVLVGSALSSAIYFGTCELSKALLSSLLRESGIRLSLSLCVPPLAGATGNLVSSAVMVPKEVVTQRMQAGAQGRSWQVLARTVAEEGIGGLYVGYSATILRNLPAGVLSFSSFEYLKALVLRRTGQPNLEPAQSVVCGAMAGAISSILTTPLDVAKTRLMTQRVGSDAATYTYKGLSSTLHKIWMEEGWLGLTCGMGPRVIHSCCFAAIGYFAFETARINLMRCYVERRDVRVSISPSPAPSAIEVAVEEKKSL